VLEEELSTKDVDDLFKEADVDKDGFINYEEFVRMMLAK